MINSDELVIEAEQKEQQQQQRSVNESEAHLPQIPAMFATPSMVNASNDLVKNIEGHMSDEYAYRLKHPLKSNDSCSNGAITVNSEMSKQSVSNDSVQKNLVESLLVASEAEKLNSESMDSSEKNDAQYITLKSVPFVQSPNQLQQTGDGQTTVLVIEPMTHHDIQHHELMPYAYSPPMSYHFNKQTFQQQLSPDEKFDRPDDQLKSLEQFETSSCFADQPNGVVGNQVPIASGQPIEPPAETAPIPEKPQSPIKLNSPSLSTSSKASKHVKFLDVDEQKQQQQQKTDEPKNDTFRGWSKPDSDDANQKCTEYISLLNNLKLQSFSGVHEDSSTQNYQ